jgi:ATP-dependent Clp protease ATP-binding subunit ClpB
MALAKESDVASQERLAALRKELADRREQLAALGDRWRTEKENIAKISAINEQIDLLKREKERAERDLDLARVSELEYGRIPELKRQLEIAQGELAATQHDGAMLKEEVGPDDIADVVSAWTGIRPAALEGATEKLCGSRRPWPPAWSGSRRLCRRSPTPSAGCGRHRRPRPAHRQLPVPRPTGVGKTELARAWPSSSSTTSEAMVRIDMSEYGEKHSVARWRAPPGYVGYEEGGQLTEAVRRRPYSVILLDEIEGPPRRLDILLQVLDDGRLTDGSGRTSTSATRS